MSPKKDTKRTASKSTGLSAEEKAAMRETLKERKMAANKEAMEEALHEKIAEMDKPDRDMANKIHEIVKEVAPELTPKTWYGMPAYANEDGKVICFFQAASKFGSRYATFGFQPDAKLDDGNMWPASFALTKLTPADEKKIKALVKKAAK